MESLKRIATRKFFLLLVLIIAAAFRLYGINWDQGLHLHPDERFLTMVGNAMVLPHSFVQYLDPNTSLFNPTNIGYKFYFYGTLPVVINKLIALATNNDTYSSFTILGRGLSAFFDLGVVVFVYKITELLLEQKKKNTITVLPFIAALLYAIAVLPIQLSHFFASDTLLNFFMTGSLYFMIRFYKNRSIPAVALSGIFFGLAIAAKVSGVFIAPLLLFFFSYPYFKTRKKIFTTLLLALLFCFTSYFSLRIAAPYYFETENVLNPQLNVLFMQNLRALKSFEGKNVWYPPGVQWINKPPVLFSLKNLALIGIGLPFFILVVIGVLALLLKGNLLRKHLDRTVLSVIFIWVLVFFLYQSVQFVKVVRYFIFIYPYLAILAAIGYMYISGLFANSSRFTRYLLQGIYVIALLIWPLAFMSIYINKTSRLAASDWIYQNLPNDSLILSEHWDDGLPMPLPENYGKTFQSEQLPVFDPDSNEKFSKMQDLLQRADYYILSSNRGWGSIPTVPEKYPRMTVFYNQLLNNKTNYKKVSEFHSYPSLRYLGIPLDFPDQWSDESFTVYDHPLVLIYKKT